MPRSQQSKEGAIVAYFSTASLEIAQVVYRLVGDALKTRVARSQEAKARAQTVAKPVAKAVPKPAQAAVTPLKKKARKRRRKVAPTAQIEEGATYTEDDLNT